MTARKERGMPSETRELVRRAREWAQGIRGLPYVADRARLLEQLADIAERAAHQERDADARRLDWLLLDAQPDTIGGLDLWDQVDAEDDDEGWSQYLRAARAAIDAAMAADTEGESDGTA